MRLIALYFVSLAFSELNATATEVCEQIDTCSCQMTDGSGLISLKSLASRNGQPSFVWTENATGNFFAYNPCYGFTIGESENQKGCRNVSLCRYSENDSKYVNIGDQKTAKFVYDRKQGDLLIRYTVSGSSAVSLVLLKCNKTNSFRLEKTFNSTTKLRLQSHCACPDCCFLRTPASLSIGSVLIIIILSLVLTYLFIGMLYNKVIYGAQGRELIPNYERWTLCLALIKDGYLFFISPCIGNKVEYRYYQKL